MNQIFIGGYWKERAVDLGFATELCFIFLKKLIEFDDLFSSLKLPAISKKKAMQNYFEITKENIAIELKRGLKKHEIDENGYSDIGYTIDLFDYPKEAYSVSVSFSIGMDSKYLTNCVYVKIRGAVIDNILRKKILNLIQETFQPETIRNE